VLAEGLTAERSAFPGRHEEAFGHAIALARSGAPDGLIAILGGLSNLDTTSTCRFSIPTPRERMPGLPMANLFFAEVLASCEGLLSSTLDDGDWPRLLLRGAVIYHCGDERAAAATLKPVVSGASAGPLGSLAIAHVAQLAGNGLLASVLAETGATRCDAAGLALEARLLTGLAPALLPAIAAEAELLAAAAGDTERSRALRALSAACIADGPPAARLETAARLAADLGAGAWLRERLLGLGRSAMAPIH